VLVRSDPNGPDDSPVNKRDSKPLSILDSKAIVGSCTSSSVGAADLILRGISWVNFQRELLPCCKSMRSKIFHT